METVNGLRKFIAPEVVFGSGSRFLVGQYVKYFEAKKVFLVTDPGIVDVGWLKDIERSLRKENIEYFIFKDITPNPKVTEVSNGSELYKQNNCDIIISIGGGSPMDCAKGIAIEVSNGGSILNFEGVNMVKKPIPPLIFIPTTAGTSSDVSQFSIISNEEKLVKIAIVSKNIIPDIALIDPELTITMSSYLTACTGIDALVHAIEAYVSIGSGPLTDLYALDAIENIVKFLPLTILNPYNIEYRNKMMLASMNAGFAFSNAILGAVHAMSHSLGGFLDLPHGECNAILLRAVVDFNFSSVPDKFREIAKKFNQNITNLSDKGIKKKILKAIENLNITVGITNRLKDIGVSKSDIPILSSKALNDACLITNPRKASKRDIEVIYEESY